MTWRVLRHVLAPLLLALQCLACAPPRSNAFAEYQRHMQQGDQRRALEALRREIADPSLVDAAYQVDLRVIALSLLWQAGAESSTGQAERDREALEYLEGGLRLAGREPRLQTSLHQAMGTYYSLTGRNGKALPHFQHAFAAADAGDLSFELFHALEGLAAAHHDMGALELRDYYERLALRGARRHFSPDNRSNVTEHHWRVLYGFLEKVMDHFAGRGHAKGVRGVVPLLQRAARAHGLPAYQPLLWTATSLAVAGDRGGAWQAFSEAERLASGGASRATRENLSCARATLLLHDRKFADSVVEWDRCAALKRSAGRDLSDAGHRDRARALEGTGRLDEAIAEYEASILSYERARMSYAPEERAGYFRGTGRTAYWGLIRALAKRSRESGAADVLAAVRAAELMRARQLGELLAGRGRPIAPARDVARLPSVLSDEELVLAYVVTASEVVLLAVDRDDQRAFLVPGGGRKLAAEVQELLARLQRPSSERADLERRLADLSAQVLGPVRAQLKRKRRIIALPDGPLGAIPFDLLSATREYSPLVRTHDVQLSPGLRLLARLAGPPPFAQEGLFVVADPAFPKKPAFGVQEVGLAAMTRSRGQAYFVPLPETREEADAVASHFESTDVEILTGRSAIESRVKRADLKRYRFVHIATHGILGGEVPGVVEPALVLAEERSGDSLLTATEASELDLNAELVVLSACNTGSGRYFSGEGVMGMGRAFLLAGSRHVVVSLWQVDSLSTTELMKRLYKKLDKGAGPVAALRAAKLEMLGARGSGASGGRRGLRLSTATRKVSSPKDWSHPYFWSAFVVLGG